MVASSASLAKVASSKFHYRPSTSLARDVGQSTLIPLLEWRNGTRDTSQSDEGVRSSQFTLGIVIWTSSTYIYHNLEPMDGCLLTLAIPSNWDLFHSFKHVYFNRIFTQVGFGSLAITAQISLTLLQRQLQRLAACLEREIWSLRTHCLVFDNEGLATVKSSCKSMKMLNLSKCNHDISHIGLTSQTNGAET